MHDNQEQDRSVFGLSENQAAMLAYIGFFITGILILIREKKSIFVRFCALQSTIFFTLTTAIEILISTTFSWLPQIGPLVLSLTTTAVMISLILLAYNAFKGKMLRVPILGNICWKIINK